MIALYRLWPWEIYLREMEQDGTYGNQVTLQVISNIYTIQICVLSTLGVGEGVDIQPQVNSSGNVQSYQQVFLGHCAEGQGEHYVALSEKLDYHIGFFSVHNNFVRSEAKADESAPDKSPDWRNLPDNIWETIFKKIFSLASSNAHITFAMNLMICITHVIVSHH